MTNIGPLEILLVAGGALVALTVVGRFVRGMAAGMRDEPPAPRTVAAAPSVTEKHTIERIVERQVVVTRCTFCGELTPVDLTACKLCGARLK